jgi:hypothetical protein
MRCVRPGVRAAPNHAGCVRAVQLREALESDYV